MAVVSDDHADPSLAVEHMSVVSSGISGGGERAQPRKISAEEMSAHDGRDGRAFYAVIDGWVVDVAGFRGLTSWRSQEAAVS